MHFSTYFYKYQKDKVKNNELPSEDGWELGWSDGGRVIFLWIFLYNFVFGIHINV